MVATKVSGFLSDHTEIYAFTEIWDKIVNQAVLCQVHKAGNSTVLLSSCLSLSSACYFCLLCLSDLDFQLLIVVSDSFGFLKITIFICSLDLLFWSALCDFQTLLHHDFMKPPLPVRYALVTYSCVPPASKPYPTYGAHRNCAGPQALWWRWMNT